MPDTPPIQASGQSSPAADAAAITPNDGQDLPSPTRAIYVGNAGTLRVQMVSGATVTFGSVQAGSVYPFRVRRVMATGTSAAGLLALR